MFVVKELWFNMHLILFMVTHFANVDGCSIAVLYNLKFVLYTHTHTHTLHIHI
jgi:hypothetical protein